MTFRLIPIGEENHKRQDNRFSRPLTLVIDGAPVETRDWGFGGFRVASIPGPDLQLDEEFFISHIMNAQGEAEPVFAIARIARQCPETGEIGVAFVHLGVRAFDLLEKAMFHRQAAKTNSPASRADANNPDLISQPICH